MDDQPSLIPPTYRPHRLTAQQRVQVVDWCRRTGKDLLLHEKPQPTVVKLAQRASADLGFTVTTSALTTQLQATQVDRHRHHRAPATPPQPRLNGHAEATPLQQQVQVLAVHVASLYDRLRLPVPEEVMALSRRAQLHAPR